jgi:DNA topoisomerase VI subunit A
MCGVVWCGSINTTYICIQAALTQAKILTIHILDTHGSTAQKEKLLMRDLKVHRKDNLLHLESNKNVST